MSIADKNIDAALANLCGCLDDSEDFLKWLTNDTIRLRILAAIRCLGETPVSFRTRTYARRVQNNEKKQQE